MSDRLIERGFATKAIFNDTTQIFTVNWTRKGLVLHATMKELFKDFGGSGAELNGADAIAMLLVILKTSANP